MVSCGAKKLVNEASLVMVLIVKWVRSVGGEDQAGGGHGNLSQYSCMENPVGRGAWGATVHRIARGLDAMEGLLNTHPHVN